MPSRVSSHATAEVLSHFQQKATRQENTPAFHRGWPHPRATSRTEVCAPTAGAKRNVKKAQQAATNKRTIAILPASTRRELGTASTLATCASCYGLLLSSAFDAHVQLARPLEQGDSRLALDAPEA
jgi:hypothetical protein